MKRKHIALLVLSVLALCVSAHSAEFLIYNKAHWMDALTQVQIAEYVKKYPKFMDKYDSRMQRGDVVEVRPDDYWTGPKAPGYDKSVFLLVTNPGLSFKDAKSYGIPLWEENKLIKKRKYNFRNVTDKQIINNMSEITITESRVISAKKAIYLIFVAILRSLLFG